MFQQQHQPVTRKRSGNEAKNGCPEKIEKLELKKDGAEITTPKPDSEDGIQISVEVEEGACQISEVTDYWLCCIQSVLRRNEPLRHGRTDGNLLKAHPGGSSRTMTVDFTGTSLDDPEAEFHMEQYEYEGSIVNILSYCSRNGSYYLAVRNAHPQVILRKSKNFPSKSKYFFRVKAVNTGVEPYKTFQSVKTDEYVRCDDDGKVSMKKATKRNSHGVPEDRGMWFNYMHKMQQHVFSQQQIMYAKVSQVISNECEQFQDDKDSGEKRFKDPENGSADDSGKGTPCDPEEGHMNDTDKQEMNGSENGTSEGPDEGDSKDLKEGDSEDLKEGNSKDVKEENSKDVKEGNSEDLKKGDSEESKERNSEKRKEGNSEEPSKNSDNVQEGNPEDTKKPTSE